MNYKINFQSQDYLEHHGILGQRWGQRNGPPYPLDSEDHSSSEKKAGWKKSLDKKTEKIRTGYSNYNKERIKSNALMKGVRMNSEQLDKANAKSLKAQKIALIIGGTAVAAIAGYALYNKIGKKYADTILNKETVLHTITDNANKSFDKTFYAAYKNADRMKYKGLFGFNKALSKAMFKMDGGVYDVSNSLKKSMKIPSEKKAASILTKALSEDGSLQKELLNALAEHRAMLVPGMNATGKQVKILDNGFRALKNGNFKDADSIYKAFNLNLVLHNTDNVESKFYNLLKSDGYNAIFDLNDLKFSGYRSDSPLIVFDTDSVVKTKIKELGFEELLVNKIPADILIQPEVMALYSSTAAISIIENKSIKDAKKENKTK